jgi:hypothetical protein
MTTPFDAKPIARRALAVLDLTDLSDSAQGFPAAMSSNMARTDGR